MRRIYWIAAGLGALVLLITGLAMAGLRLAPLHTRDFDPQAARVAAQAYDAEITRDEWGVPRVIGETDADAAFAIAYAHAEDDFATIQQSLRAALGPEMLAAVPSEARTAYLIQLLRLREQVEAGYETDLSSDVRAILEAYAAGLNLYAAQHSSERMPDLFPVTGRDVAVLTSFFSPLFYGFGETVAALVAPEAEQDPSRGQELQVMLQQGPSTELGSNAFAVAPSRSTDGWTRVIVNSHQPVDGALAWYEAHMISREGLNMVGGMFPGAPAIHLGVSPHLAQAATVNYPDLIDIYELTLDGDGYVLDGESQAFDSRTASMTVRLFGPFAWRVTRPAEWSAHGPVLRTDRGAFAIRYATLGDIRFIEQAYRMMRARSVDEFQTALDMGAMGNTNRIVGDREGQIARFYLARMPSRNGGADVDWTGILPGDRSDLIWETFEPFSALPHMINPEPGYVLEANHSPFEVTQTEADPDPADYPAWYGVETSLTNRARRAIALMASLDAVSRDDLLGVKYDAVYAPGSVAARVQAEVLAHPWPAELDEAVGVLARWDLSTDLDNRSAALGIMTSLPIGVAEAAGEPAPSIEETFPAAAALLAEHHGRLDPLWSEVNFLHRGDQSAALAGGPDTLRAVNSVIDEESGTLSMASGDGLHMLAEWAPGAELPDVWAVHQFGASNDPSSPHYADQLPLFAAEELRAIPMTEEAVRAAAVRIYRPGAE